MSNGLEDILYETLATPETGAVTDALPLTSPERFIRTKAVGSGSSAYGPVQITKTLVEDYLNRFPDIFDEAQKGFASRYIDQGNTFLHNKKGDFGYGGAGALNSPEDIAAYEDMAKRIIGKMWEMVPGKTEEAKLQRFLQAWRGVAEEADPKYFASAKETFSKKEGPGSGPALTQLIAELPGKYIDNPQDSFNPHMERSLLPEMRPKLNDFILSKLSDPDFMQHNMNLALSFGPGSIKIPPHLERLIGALPKARPGAPTVKNYFRVSEIAPELQPKEGKLGEVLGGRWQPTKESVVEGGGKDIVGPVKFIEKLTADKIAKRPLIELTPQMMEEAKAIDAQRKIMSDEEMPIRTIEEWKKRLRASMGVFDKATVKKSLTVIKGGKNGKGD